MMPDKDRCIDKFYRQLATKKTSLRAIHGNITANTDVQVVVYSGIVMLYAYFEGYIKEIASKYLDYVSKTANTVKDSNTFIKVRAYQKIIKSDVFPKRNYCLFGDFLNELKDYDSNFLDAINQDVNTESNISSRVLLDILKSVGIDNKVISGDESILTCVDDLLKARNNIAHTGYGPVSFGIYQDLYDNTIKAMDVLLNAFVDAVLNEQYLELVSSSS